jgi:hypothetical protein
MAECSFVKFAPLEWYLIFAMLACFTLGVIQLRKLHAALLVRPRQTIPRAVTFGAFGVLLCALPLFDTILFAAGRPSALVSLASARAGWCDLAKLNAEKSEQIGQLTKRVSELETRVATQEPADAAPAPAMVAQPAVVKTEEVADMPTFAPPVPQPKPDMTAATGNLDPEATTVVDAAKRDEFRVVVYYRRSHTGLAGDLSSRMGERFETVAEPSDLKVKTVKSPGTIRIVYTENSAFALPEVRKALSDALHGDEAREIVADKVNDLRNGDLQIQLF